MPAMYNKRLTELSQIKGLEHWIMDEAQKMPREKLFQLLDYIVNLGISDYMDIAAIANSMSFNGHKLPTNNYNPKITTNYQSRKESVHA
jgi:hypothetical protein